MQSIFTSKTFWAGALTVVAAALTALQSVNPTVGAWVTVVLALITTISHSTLVAGKHL